MSLVTSEAALLDRIYHAAVEPDLWREVLEGVSDRVGGGPINLTSLSEVDGRGFGLAARSDPSAMAAYFEHFAPLNPFITGDPDGDGGEWTPTVYTDDQAFDRDAYVRSEFFNDHVRRVGGEWSMVIRLGRAAGRVSTIHVGRPDRRGRFEPHELATARRLQPHLIRAFALTSRLAQTDSLAAGLRTALDQSADAMLLTDASGRLLYANAAGERLLRVGAPLGASCGRLTASTPSATTRLAGLIAAATATREAPSGGSMILTGGSGRTLTINVLPMRGASGLFAAAPAALVTVPDPGRRAPSPEQLAERYGLTPAECRVALALLDGASLRDMAARFDIRPNTVRAQLGAVFAKTGAHRQADLVRLLLDGDGPVRDP